MCLIAFCYRQHRGYRLVLAANRDEFLDRPTAQLAYNYPGEKILAGKDLRGGGTWLGLGENGRLAAITNYRDPATVLSSAPSRGEIILDYLRSGQSAAEFLHRLSADAKLYNGFNLLVADSDTLLHFSNVSMRDTLLEPGIYGVSNHLLDTSWPKVVWAKQSLRRALRGNDDVDRQGIFHFLQSNVRPEEDQLPETGVGQEWERLLSPIFIHSPTYGTRSSALITIADDGRTEFHERTYLHGNGEVQLQGKKTFQLGPY